MLGIIRNKGFRAKLRAVFVSVSLLALASAAPNLNLDEIRPVAPGLQPAGWRWSPIHALAPGRVVTDNLTRVLEESSRGSVAASGSGSSVPGYRNEIDPLGLFYQPGAGERIADDLRLITDACQVTRYQLQVFSDGGGPFDVHTAIWNGDPCLPGSIILAGSERDFNGLQPDVVLTLDATPDPAVGVPQTVWLAATFSTDEAGWFLADVAELGFSFDLWSEDDVNMNQGCLQVNFQPPAPDAYGAFWATVDCAAIGACCTAESCSEVLHSQCTEGTWMGALSSCEPSPCLARTCCSGSDLLTCTEGTAADCPTGEALLGTGTSCDDDPCTAAFRVYENDFETGQASVVGSDALWADDLTLGPGAPCDLLAYQLMMRGAGTAPFDVETSLWTNDDGGTSADPSDDVPLLPISGTEWFFVGVPGDTTPQTLLAGSFDDAMLPKKIWLVFSTSLDDTGPVLAGMANLGSSEDGFAIFDNSSGWESGLNFGGFNAGGCPGPRPPGGACVPAGSFQIRVWCKGDPPTGACCNDVAVACLDDVAEADCPGRWAPERSCDSDPLDPTFDPPCGTAACCTPITPCQEKLPAECKSAWEPLGIPFIVARGSLCSDLDFECPPMACYGASGDCLLTNETAGCDNPTCCETVCGFDPMCCESAVGWDGVCASLAEAICDLAPVCFKTCGDFNGDVRSDLSDFATFTNCFGQSPNSSETCKCADLNGDGAVNLADFAIVAELVGNASIDLPPNCP